MKEKKYYQENNPFSEPKSCAACHHRVAIGEKFKKRNIFLLIIGLPLIYIPFFLGVWLIFYLAGLSCYWHLKLMGASKSLKKLRDFMPDPKSHRYSYTIPTGLHL